MLEVRAADRPGVVYLVCAALAGLDVAVRSAHVDTLGPQAVDVFYVQGPRPGRSATRGRPRPRTPSGTRSTSAVSASGAPDPGGAGVVVDLDRAGPASSGEGTTSLWCSFDFEVAVGAGPGRVEDVDEVAQRVGGAATTAPVRRSVTIRWPAQSTRPSTSTPAVPNTSPVTSSIVDARG